MEDGASEIESMQREIKSLKRKQSSSASESSFSGTSVRHGAIGGSSNAVVNINFPCQLPACMGGFGPAASQSRAAGAAVGGPHEAEQSASGAEANEADESVECIVNS